MPMSEWPEILARNRELLDASFFERCDARIRWDRQNNHPEDAMRLSEVANLACQLTGRPSEYRLEWKVMRPAPDTVTMALAPASNAVTTDLGLRLQALLADKDPRARSRIQASALFLEHTSRYGSYLIVLVPTGRGGSDWAVVAEYCGNVLERRGRWDARQTEAFFRSLAEAGVLSVQSEVSSTGGDHFRLHFLWKGQSVTQETDLNPSTRQFLSRFCAESLGKLATRMRWDLVREFQLPILLR